MEQPDTAFADRESDNASRAQLLQALHRSQAKVTALTKRLDHAISDAESDRESLRRLYEKIETGLWDFEVSAKHQWYSSRFMELIAMADTTDHDNLLWSLGELIHPEDDSARSVFIEFLSTGASLDLEARIQTAPDQYRWVRMRGGALDEQSNRHISGGIEDIDVQKQLELERDDYAKRLEHSNTALGEFARLASHDLQAPLRHIKQLAAWVLEDCGDLVPAPSQAHLQTMRTRISRMQSMLAEMLDYARIDSGKSTPGLVDLNALAQEVIDTVVPPERQGIVLRAPSQTVRVAASPVRYCLQNLVDNALKHTPPDTVIEICIEIETPWVCLRVRDHGPGIREADHDKVFEMYQRLHGDKGPEGSGLGLAMVRRTVQTAGGRLSLVSEPGKGAEFSIYWPLNES